MVAPEERMGWWGDVALAALAAAVLGGRIASGDLVGDPLIYAAVAKDILARGDWGTLWLGGTHFFDKPPLVMWLAAVSFWLFGVSTWSARLPGVAASVLACLALARLGRRLVDARLGLCAGAVLVLTPGFVRFGSTLLLDSPMVLCALLGFHVVARAWERGGAGLWLAGALFGLAFLAKGALALGAPAVLAVLWAVSPRTRPPLGTVVGAGVAFLVVALPWHLYEMWRWGNAFVRGHLYDVTAKMGPHPDVAAYLLVLAKTTLPWLPVALVGMWRTWRTVERPRGIRLLVVWTVVAYAFLLTAGKHSPRYLMLLHPALALWAALAVWPWLPAMPRLAGGIGVAAAVVWAVVALWPGPLHRTGYREAIVALEPDLGPRGTPVIGFRVLSQAKRAGFAYHLGRDVETAYDVNRLAALPAGTPVVTEVANARVLAADGRFARTRRTRDYVAFQVKPREWGGG